jgi:type II secretory pathway pseudopilin PulG
MKSTTAVTIIIVVVVLGLLGAYAFVYWTRQLADTMKARAEVARSEEYKQLSELAVTTQEHTDLKLSEINMQLGQLRTQLEQVQKILKDVE